MQCLFQGGMGAGACLLGGRLGRWLSQLHHPWGGEAARASYEFWGKDRDRDGWRFHTGKAARGGWGCVSPVGEWQCWPASTFICPLAPTCSWAEAWGWVTDAVSGKLCTCTRCLKAQVAAGTLLLGQHLFFKFSEIQHFFVGCWGKTGRWVLCWFISSSSIELQSAMKGLKSPFSWGCREARKSFNPSKHSGSWWVHCSDTPLQHPPLGLLLPGPANVKSRPNRVSWRTTYKTHDLSYLWPFTWNWMIFFHQWNECHTPLQD